jgi:hypothetical protein
MRAFENLAPLSLCNSFGYNSLLPFGYLVSTISSKLFIIVYAVLFNNFLVHRKPEKLSTTVNIY